MAPQKYRVYRTCPFDLRIVFDTAEDTYGFAGVEPPQGTTVRCHRHIDGRMVIVASHHREAPVWKIQRKLWI